MITYKNIDGTHKVAVYLEKKRIGTIEPVGSGWRYFPKGKDFGGELLNSLQAVKRSLEAE